MLLHCKRERIASNETERMATFCIFLGVVILAIKGKVCNAYDCMVINFGILCRCVTVILIILSIMEF